jgi:aryl-alcohol dehydrogenase-like predicted oxidoreductase
VALDTRVFGRSGLKVSILGFGCGAVGGLMVRGDPRDQERTIARALEHGVNYFDTAVQYGDGESERNLGSILKKLKPASVFVGTKVRVPDSEFGRIGDFVTKSLQDSLRRLKMEGVDIFHLHNEITVADGRESLSIKQVLSEILPAFDKLKQRGMTRLLGITAIGDTAALHEAIDSHLFDSAQICYNMLNPSAGAALPPDYPAQDYRKIFDHTQAAGVGVVGIRVLAGGALTGATERHPIASPPPLPIGSASSYAADMARAERLLPLVNEGWVGSLSEAATRFAISHPAMGTILVGMATLEQFEQALTAVQKGPLPKSALDRLATLQQGFVDEAR